MNKHRWKITEVLTMLGKDDNGGMILGFKLGLRTEDNIGYKKHKKTIRWYKYGFTVSQLRMVNWLLKELCPGNIAGDGEVLTSRLGDLVYYKPKDLL